jgi:hypothetical protein
MVKPGGDGGEWGAFALIKYDSAIPRRDAPEFLQKPSAQELEGAGNAGCPLHPQME